MKLVWIVATMVMGIAAGSLVLAWSKRPSEPPASPLSSPPTPTKEEGNMISVRVFDASGKLVGPIRTNKIERSDAEWQAQLSGDQFRILRAKGTERPFCGTLLDNKQEGVYCCAGCGLPLFASNSKFQSGTGWPSFFQPIAPENVVESMDGSHGMMRIEILCARCDGHLGHVFDDGPPPTGRRFCLNSESLTFTGAGELAKLADPIANSAGKESAKGKTATAVLTGGCFWCTEAAFAQLKGVSDVESGYTGDSAATANYQRVCQGDTKHAEAIRITYDPTQVSYDQLLDVFFEAHDPTQLNRQGADVGPQYRSAIFFATPGEKAKAEAKIAEWNGKKVFSSPIVTTLEPLGEFYPAEDYHQDYADRNPDDRYILFRSTPKVCKVRDKFPELIKPSESNK